MIDPSIALSYNPQPLGPNVGQTVQSANALLGLLQQKQQMQTANTLKQILGAPGAIDATGQPTPEALGRVTAVDPAMGIQLRQNTLKQQQTQLQQDYLKTNMFAKQFEMTHDVSDSALVAYEDAIKNGIPEPAARSQAQRVQSEGLENLRRSGLFSEQQQASFPQQFDPAQARSHVMNYQQWNAAQEKQKADAKAEAQEAERERHDRAMEGKVSPAQSAETDALTVAASNISAAEAEKGSSLTEAEKAGIRQQARMAPKVAEAAAKAESTAISDDAAKLTAEESLRGDFHGTVGMGRNQASMRKIADWRAKLAKEQGITGADLAANTAEFNGIMSAERVLGTRGAGIDLGIAEAQKFAPMVLDLSNKIDRTRFPTVNSLQLAIEKGTGGENVIRLTDALNAYKMAYTQILTRGGMPTDDSRRRSDEVIDKAWSNGQIKAAIDQLNKEMEAASSAVPAVRDNLRQALTGKAAPSARAAPGAKLPPALPDEGGKIPAITNDAAGRDAFGKLAPGAQFMAPDGKVWTKEGAAPAANKAPAPDNAAALSAAKDAIAKGAPRDKVIQRLKDNGIDPAGL